MADTVDLDPGDYAGTYKLVGGAPALDFANLVSYRDTARHHDWLVPTANLERWTRAAGLAVDGKPELPLLLHLREMLARVFLAIADGRTPATDDIDGIGLRAASAAARRRLRFRDGADAATWVDPETRGLAEVLADDAATMLTSPDTVRRIAACQECRWVFLDTTRNHSRRWCDPADCGNRARQRRHYHRTRN